MLEVTLNDCSILSTLDPVATLLTLAIFVPPNGDVNGSVVPPTAGSNPIELITAEFTAPTVGQHPPIVTEFALVPVDPIQPKNVPVSKSIFVQDGWTIVAALVLKDNAVDFSW